MSPSANLTTLKDYEALLSEGDRWIELAQGRLVRLNPPDEIHGDVVRNLARALAVYLKKSNELSACFELPLVLKQDPPVVRCPAVSCFRSDAGNRFAETDKLMTETRPVLVIEVASTNERREAMSNRVREYLSWGVDTIWVIDPVTRHVHLFRGHDRGDMLKDPQVLVGHPALPGFAIPVSDLFQQPAWMKKAPAPFDE